MPVGSPRVACMIEMAADGKPPIRKEDTKIPHVSQVGTQISSFKHYQVCPQYFKVFKLLSISHISLENRFLVKSSQQNTRIFISDTLGIIKYI